MNSKQNLIKKMVILSLALAALVGGVIINIAHASAASEPDCGLNQVLLMPTPESNALTIVCVVPEKQGVVIKSDGTVKNLTAAEVQALDTSTFKSGTLLVDGTLPNGMTIVVPDGQTTNLVTGK